MTKVLVLFYSSWGHVEAMAEAAAAGAREAGAHVDVKRVPELVPAEVAKQFHYKEPTAPVANPGELADYDAVIVGTPTRYGNMAAQMRNFLDQTGALWQGNKLVGKVASMFVSTATQHGGQESTILSSIPTFLHLGMVYVGLPYSFAGQFGHEHVLGSSPYGAATIAGGDGSRRPSKVELEAAHFQGKHVAEIAAKLAK
ncbi:MAG: NAD(P)H:quinone oxidoreductase [Hyphomicrobiales bacterium]|nr:NAD(P)H:quinone oxidoreductase [Hyphomicrobiales bacterium]